MSNASQANHAREDKYAAIYVRVPTEDQGKGFSIPMQIEACRERNA
jgi:hypothetical protein